MGIYFVHKLEYFVYIIKTVILKDYKVNKNKTRIQWFIKQSEYESPQVQSLLHK